MKKPAFFSTLGRSLYDLAVYREAAMFAGYPIAGALRCRRAAALETAAPDAAPPPPPPPQM